MDRDERCGSLVARYACLAGLGQHGHGHELEPYVYDSDLTRPEMKSHDGLGMDVEVWSSLESHDHGPNLGADP